MAAFGYCGVALPRIELGSGASETHILSIVLQGRQKENGGLAPAGFPDWSQR